MRLLAIGVRDLVLLATLLCPLRADAERLPVVFEENLGQADARARFLARGLGFTLLLGPRETLLSLRGTLDGSAALIRCELLGAATSRPMAGLDPLPGRSHYFLGADPSRFRTNVPHYGRVHAGEVYPGVDLVYRSAEGTIEYDFVVAPGADPGDIAVAIDGADDVRVEADGALAIHVCGGTLRQAAPLAYQERAGRRERVCAAYILDGGRGRPTWGLDVGPYDRGLPLVIDPVITYSTYLGGSLGDWARVMAVDATGSAVVAGETMSSDFPTELPLQGGLRGSSDIFVTKLDPSGSAVLFSTYLGGSGDDELGDLGLDETGNMYLTGSGSADFPLVNPIQVTGPTIVAKVDPAGSAILYSTKLDCGVRDGTGATPTLGVDGSGNVFVGGRTYGFRSCQGGDAVLCKIDSPGSRLLFRKQWCRYQFGSEDLTSVTADPAGNVYLTGISSTSHGEWPYYAKLSPEGDFLYGAIVGTGYIGDTYDIEVDGSGNAYVLAMTYDGGPSVEYTIRKIDPAGAVVWIQPQVAADLAVTADGDSLLVTGVGYPNSDVRLTVLDPAGNPVSSQTFGGSASETGYSVAADSAGAAYVAGATTSTDFPVSNPYQATLGGGTDAFVTKLWDGCGVLLGPPALPAAAQGVPYSVTLTSSGGTAPYTYALVTGAPPPGFTLSPAGVLAGTPGPAGLYVLFVEATDAVGCRGQRTYALGICGAMDLVPLGLPPATVGVSYGALVEARFGVTPYFFAVTAGAMPPGLSLSSGGQVNGTPTAAGLFDVTVTATDRIYCQASRTYRIVVNAPGCAPILIAPPALPAAVIGQAYSQQLSATGGQAPYTFALGAGALPAGLNLATSGLISGSAASAGSFPFVASATDASGCQGSRPYRIDVGEGFALGQGLGDPNPPRVRIYTAGGVPTPVDFMAYATSKWGVNVTAGDVAGDATSEILTGPGPGPNYGPTVRGFLGEGEPIAAVHFYAYGTLRYGVNVAAGDVDGDGADEILTAPGPGAVFGPHVRGFDAGSGPVQPIAGVSFFAYATPRFGAQAGGGDIDGDGFGEILTGPGPSPAFAPLVRGWDHDGSGVRPIGGVNFWAFPALQYGVLVAGGDADGDGFDEIAAAPGPGPGPSFVSRFRGFDVDGAPVNELPGFDVTAFATSYGGRLDLGDASGDAVADLAAGAGRDPAADTTLKSYRYAGASLQPLLPSFVPFPGVAYGVTVALGAFGF